MVSRWPSIGRRIMKIVIIGGVAGGMSAATRARRLDANAEIIVLEKSGHVSYANCGLPYYVGGIIEEEKDLLLQTPESLHARFRLDVRISSEVIAINRIKKTVSVRNLLSREVDEIGYDKLILSPGASPVVPPIPGVERAMTLRTVEDVERITNRVNEKPANAVVIGGGFIGVEIAENLIHRGIKTALVEAMPQVLAPLDPEMASLVAKEMALQGVELHLADGVSTIDPTTVTLTSGAVLPADLVILAIGVRPDTSLAKAADIKVGTRGGIEVDDFNRTSDPDIYAVGDAAEKVDALDGEATLVPLANLANRHGRVAADHISGLITRPVKTIGTAIVKVFDLMIATTGWNEKRLSADGRAYMAIHTHPNSHAGYYPDAKQMALKLLFDPTTGEILGAQGVGIEGVDKRIDVIATAIRGGITAPELADLELAYAPPFGSAKDPVNMLGYISENLISGLLETAQWNQIDDFVAKGFDLVDVRTAAEFGRGSIPGAISMPVDEIRDRVSELKNKNVLVNCQVGQRGHTATMLLKELGFNAVNLDGGYLTWSNSPIANKEKVNV
jgi:NADPH-dependent 2,4-dienoyl-CoA reductase/sulfur reductase-like enzyme/rhodanese-related sulfurtransferase